MSENPAPKEKNALNELSELVGYDVTKRPRVSKSGFEEVKAELLAEREAQGKAMAKELLQKVDPLVKERLAAEKNFQQVVQKFDKEASKLVNNIKALANGAPPTEEPEE